MHFLDLKGRAHSIDIRPSAWPRKDKESARSHFQWLVGEVLSELYPTEIILEEFPCLGEHLYVDFFLPRKKLVVEAQGQQHDTFNPFYHTDKATFLAQRARDERKAEWCATNKLHLVTIQYTLDVTTIKRCLAAG
jgi:hypothetical protein